jgi:hypothetical protein
VAINVVEHQQAVQKESPGPATRRRETTGGSHHRRYVSYAALTTVQTPRGQKADPVVDIDLALAVQVRYSVMQSSGWADAACL